jgi:UDP-glucuronate 4-epimerase
MPADRGADGTTHGRSGAPGRFLVTGALGAIGVWTMRSLLDRGHAVVAMDVSGDGHRLPVALDEGRLAALVRVDGDITDLAAVERVMDDHGITGVIHLAALQVPFVRADPPLGARVNVVGTVNMLEAVRRRADRMGPLVYASSIAAFGAAGTMRDEDQPGTLYGVYKRANESTALRYFEDFGVSSIGLRPHTVYGPGRDQGLTSAPTAAMVAAVARVPFHIPYGGSAQMQYAPDVGEAFARAAEARPEGAAVHSLDGPVAGMGEVLAAIEAAVPDAQGLITADEQPLPFPAETDSSSFVELLGGPVVRPLRDGVQDAVRHFERLLANGVVRRPEPPVASTPAG